MNRAARGMIERAARAPRVLLALDLDGTLAPIRRRPGAVRLPPRRRALLERLGRGRVRLAFLSGRALKDLRARVGVRGADYAGAFGLVMSGPGGAFTHPRALSARRAAAALAARLRRALAGVPGALVEDKGAGVCVHHRAVPPGRRAEFVRRLARVRALPAPGLRWRRAARAWEVAPAARWDKGRAVLRLWRRHGRPFLVAVGDDRFDEPMLRAARARGGAVRVGRGRSAARLRLRGVPQVWDFLRALERRALRTPRARAPRRGRARPRSGARPRPGPSGGRTAS